MDKVEVSAPSQGTNTVFRISKSFFPELTNLDVLIPTTPNEDENDPESANKSPLGFKFPAFTLPTFSLGTNNEPKDEATEQNEEKTDPDALKPSNKDEVSEDPSEYSKKTSPGFKFPDFTLPTLPTFSLTSSTSGNNETKDVSKQDDKIEKTEESEPLSSQQQQQTELVNNVSSNANSEGDDPKIIDKKSSDVETEKLEDDECEFSRIPEGKTTTTSSPSKIFSGFKMPSIRLPTFSGSGTGDVTTDPTTAISDGKDKDDEDRISVDADNVDVSSTTATVVESTPDEEGKPDEESSKEKPKAVTKRFNLFGSSKRESANLDHKAKEEKEQTKSDQEQIIKPEEKEINKPVDEAEPKAEEQQMEDEKEKEKEATPSSSGRSGFRLFSLKKKPKKEKNKDEDPSKDDKKKNRMPLKDNEPQEEGKEILFRERANC